MAYSIGDYPLPKYAAYVWIEGENLCLGFPPLEGHERGHSVKIALSKCALKVRLKDFECSCGRRAGKIEDDNKKNIAGDQLGWLALLETLQARQRDSAKEEEFNRIARKSAPVQSQIDQWIKREGVEVFTEEGHRQLSDKELDDLLGS